MSDVAICFDGEGFDLVLKDGDLLIDDGLETAVLISLFSDARVDEIDRPALSNTLGGWFGDVVNGFKIGSKLWLFDRAKNRQANAVIVEQYCNDALAWLISESIVKSINTSATILSSGISIRIEITKRDDSNLKYSFIWQGQGLKHGI